MCGFSGVFGDFKKLSFLEKNILDKTLEHRGETAFGSFENNKFFLHCRRLAIRNLSHDSNQPFLASNSRYICAYNGEIYNEKILKRKLNEKGIQIETSCDTEVVIKFLINFGLDKINQIDGMFSIVIFDQKLNKLFLARDRFGVKPLYIKKIRNSFYFSSEIKSLVSMTQDKSKVSVNNLYNYLTFQNFFKDNTIFEDILLLEPGYFYEIKHDSSFEVIKKKYWDINLSNKKYKKNNYETFNQFSLEIKKSINKSLISDEEVGCLLSGGLDSSTIAYYASQKINQLNTFTVGYDRKYNDYDIFDERIVAESIANTLGTNHYETLLNPKNVINIFDKLVYAVEEPRVGMSYPNFMSYQLASKFNKVILSGTGGDEILGGYPWRYLISNSLNFNEFKNELFKKWQKVYKTKELSKITGLNELSLKKITFEEFSSIFNEIEDIDPNKKLNFNESFDLSLYFEFKTFLHGLLVIEDKIAMHHKVENRVPMLTNNLVDFSFKLPIEMKLSNYNIKLNENNLSEKRSLFLNFDNKDGKNILRKLSKKIYGNTVYNLNKKGFSSPDSEWFRTDLYDFIHDRLITNKNSKIFNYLNHVEIKKIILQHKKGTKNNRLKIWSLLYLESFFRQYT